MHVRFKDGWFYYLEEIRQGNKLLALVGMRKAPYRTENTNAEGATPSETSSGTVPDAQLLSIAEDRLQRAIEDFKQKRGDAFSFAPDSPAVPDLPTDPASRIEAISAALRRATGLRRLPSRVQILHTTQPVTLSDGSQRQWQARVNNGRIEINAANITSEQEAIWNLEHELGHEAFRNPTPALKRAWQNLTKALSAHPDIRAEVEALRYTPDQLTEEQAVRLAQKLDDQGPWSAAWAALKEALYDFLTGNWGSIGTRFTDQVSAALAARAIMADARRRLRPDPSNPEDLAAYLTTPEAAALSLKPSDLQPDGTPKPEVLAEIEAEKAEIKARAQADGTWMQAPNGQPSKLNPDQWVAVRTRRFKEWFGDWESANHNSFLDGHPVATMQGNEVPVFPKLGQLAQWVADYWEDQHGGSVTREDLGAIALDQAAASSSIGHGMGAVKGQAFYLVPEVLKQGRLLGKLPHIPNKPDAYIIAAPAAIGSETFTILVEVRRDTNSQRLYVHEAVKRKLQTGFNSAAATSPKGNAKPHSPAGAIKSFMEKLRSVNPDSVSKVVDENGEPMVVWHNSEAKFTSFDLSRARTSSDIQALFFKDREDPYNEYGRNRYPSFLNLRNPANYRQAMAGFDAASTDDAGTRQRKKLQGEGFDGFWISEEDGGMDYAELGAFSPTQIKSATANTGTYSSENADIRYSFAPEQSDNQPTQTGRAQPLNAPVLTPDGWRPIGELAVGDIITSHQGTTSTVTGVFPQGRKQVFKITLEDGRTVRATADHLWLALYDQRDGIMTTQHLINHIARGRTVKLPVMKDEVMVG